MSDETRFLQGIELKLASDGIGDLAGRFTGYGAVFGNVDSHGDVIAPGAFTASLQAWKKSGKLPPMLLQHGGLLARDMDTVPVGVWTDMNEDAKGLRVEGRIINLKTDRGQTIYGAMKEGALDGLSIGYRTKKYTTGRRAGEPHRQLDEVDLVEVSIVTFPSNSLARTQSVKSIDSRAAFERFLRDAGFPKRAAEKIALNGWSGFAPSSDNDAAAADLVASIKSATAALKGN